MCPRSIRNSWALKNVCHKNNALAQLNRSIFVCLFTFIAQHSSISRSRMDRIHGSLKSSGIKSKDTHLQLHSHGRRQSPFLQPGYAWHMSQLSPCQPTLHRHSPGFLQYPCDWLQFFAHIAEKRQTWNSRECSTWMGEGLGYLRMWHRMPVHPAWHLHSSGFVHEPCWQPGRTWHSLHVGPAQPRRHRHSPGISQ